MRKNSRKQRLFLHIGCEKTGTTSIQHLLASNREKLMAQGVIYPPMGQTPTAQFCLPASLVGLEFYPGDAGTFEEVWGHLARVCQKHPHHDVVVSAEHLSSRLKKEHIGRVEAYLRSALPDTEVIILVYLRRQDTFIESSYSTAIKAGSTQVFKQFVADFERRKRHDYLHLLDMWAEAFGVEALSVFVYEEARDQGLLHHFCQQLGVKINEDWTLPSEENTAWSLKMLDLARIANQPQLKSLLGKRRLAFLNKLADSEALKGPAAPLMSPELRQKVIAHYEASNREVASKYLGRGSGALFADDGKAPALVDNTDVNRRDLVMLLILQFLERDA